MSTTFDIGGNAATSFPFDNVGATVTGKILAVEEIQQTDLDSGKPAFWDTGQPKMQYRVNLQTGLADPADPADDGKRAVYLRGSRKPESLSSLAAVLTAVRQATGKTELAVGATLTLAYTGDGTSSSRGRNAPKQYQARYSPPNVNLDQQPASADDVPPF